MKIVTWQNESLLPSSTLASHNITYFIRVIYWRLICKHTCIPVSPRKCHKQYLVVTILYSVTKNNVLHTQCSYMIGERQSNECMELSSKSIYINIHRIEKQSAVIVITLLLDMYIHTPLKSECMR